MSDNNFIRSTFYIRGMHCASCEILIEKKIIKLDSVEMVDTSLAKGQVTIEHERGDGLSAVSLNKLFNGDGYKFSDTPFKKNKLTVSAGCDVPAPRTSPYFAVFIALLLIIGFVFLNRTGFTSLVSVSATSSLPVFFVFGLLAGFSSCAALVGGIILSVSKQWVSQYGNSDDTSKKLEPHFLFNIGRVGGYAVFGALLGLLGNFFKMSPIFTALLVISVSFVMVLLGLQMLGVKALKNFQIRLPKSLTGKVADESNFHGRFAPLFMGALTFFLPCGFTITAQALALTSGNPIQGALIMALFALGTVPGLLAIGFSSVKLFGNPKVAHQFSTVAGMLVLFFALFNVNAQLNVLGLPNLSDAFASSSSTTLTADVSSNVSLVNGKQVIKLEASSFAYTPNRFTIRANTPTRLEVTDAGFSGCTNAIISRGLFDGQLDLVKGGVAVKEFTSPQPGVYKFSCWMGMVSGVVEVVDGSGSTGSAANTAPVDSGAKGCGCGGGSGSCGMR